MTSYCTLQDVYDLGLAAEAFVTRARPFDAVDATTATIRIPAHGFSLDDQITFEVTDGGTLPTGISEFTVYFPIPVSANLFRVSLTSHGSPIASWVSAGTGWGIVYDPTRKILAHIAEQAAFIDEHLTGEEPPLRPDPITGKFPQQIVGMNARLAARAAVNSLQVENAAYRVAVDRLFAREAKDMELLDIWLKGKPINPRPTDQTDDPENAPIAEEAYPATDWRNGGLL